ncbi:hypothetical protein AB0L85_12445 [Streptomyces sp. NPDC052051]|uniref:hypothetical protein n=1 Tax=Streptomyces sp. NPDC052051 TaxID=3154649 RepID=UPI003438DFF1
MTPGYDPGGSPSRDGSAPRRTARVLWWLVALIVVALPLGYGLFSTHACLSGYRTAVTDGRGPDVFAWKDPAGRTVRGPIDGVPEDGVWDKEADAPPPGIRDGRHFR